MLDVLCVGEALVDFLPEAIGKPVRQVERWVRCLGGAPSNVTVGVARLGGRSALLGVTGDDEHGWFIAEALAKEGVDVSHLRHTREGKTGLAFVSIDAQGQRSFVFYRDHAAEFLLGPLDADEAFVAQAKAVHFGTNSLLTEQARATSQKLAHGAKARGQIVSTDPNLRLHIWKEPEVLRRLIEDLVAQASTVKLSEEEIEFVTGEREPLRALEALERRGVTVGVVTLGAQGALLRAKGEVARVEAPEAKVVDTTGAGDGFTSGWLYGLTRRFGTQAALAQARVEQLVPAARLGCAVGTRVTEALGAVAGLPRAAEVPAALLEAVR